MLRFRIYVWCLLAVLLVYGRDYRPDAIALAIAPYEFNLVSWELGNLPDKWARRVVDALPFADRDAEDPTASVQRYFEIGRRLWEIDRRLTILDSPDSAPRSSPAATADLRRQFHRLRAEQDAIRPQVEEHLESAVAGALRDLGFGTRIGIFPPVDTVLTGSPTVLILSPRDRIERRDGGLLHTGLDRFQREEVETPLETGEGWSALVENTGGIALYPSITTSRTSLEQAVEIIAHEWVHQWLWFRPLGRRYFEGGDITAINETVATIAGSEIGGLALQRLALQRMDERSPVSGADAGPASARPPSTYPSTPPPFDFQAEMRATRLRVDELLAAGNIYGAEAYMEERRRLFVDEGYPIRKLNQAYFAFHGTYTTTGAAGVSIIGEQVQELRRRSPSVRDFLRTAAQITSAGDLAAYVDGARP